MEDIINSSDMISKAEVSGCWSISVSKIVRPRPLRADIIAHACQIMDFRQHSAIKEATLLQQHSGFLQR